MPTVINTNLASLFAQNNLSSALRINDNQCVRWTCGANYTWSSAEAECPTIPEPPKIVSISTFKSY
jgi:hypothetical protein